MKPLLSPTLAALAALLLLSGCPDNKVPKAPPKIPEPKAAQPSMPAAPLAFHASVLAPHSAAPTQA